MVNKGRWNTSTTQYTILKRKINIGNAIRKMVSMCSKEILSLPLVSPLSLPVLIKMIVSLPQIIVRKIIVILNEVIDCC